jgi:hypothetical protein
MKRTLGIAAGLLLAGCVMNKLNARLAPFVGQDVHVAIGKLGYPNDTRVVVGDTVYTWITDIRAPYPCKIELVAGPGGIVKTYALEGTEPGCARYNDALDQ